MFLMSDDVTESFLTKMPILAKSSKNWSHDLQSNSDRKIEKK